MITLSWKPEKAYDNAEREKVKVSLEAAYDPETVSYTHLDVYKRQLFTSRNSEAGRMGRFCQRNRNESEDSDIGP